MPNWCENDLYMNASNEKIAEVLAFIGADQDPPKFNFDAVIPYPSDFQRRDDLCSKYRESNASEKAAMIDEMVSVCGKPAGQMGGVPYFKDGYNSGGYEWCIQNWGTKWDASDVVHARDRLSFRTAWSPPLPVIDALAKRFPDVTFHIEYFERGGAYCGGATWPSTSDADKEYCANTRTREWYCNDYRGSRGG